MNRRQIFFGATLAAAVAILIVLATHIDLPATWIQLARVGFSGAVAILIDMALALLGPLLAWHIMMGSDGIDIRLGTTLVSGVMGRAINLISPMMYFGGEGVRTFHVAGVTGIPRRRVLATIAAAEFQALAALSASVVAALILVAAGNRTAALPLRWMVTGSLGMALIVGLTFCLLLMDFHLAARVFGFLMRFGIFTEKLSKLRDAATDVQNVVRNLVVRNKWRFIAAQLLAFTSPLAHFVLPAIFFWFLRTSGQTSPQPTIFQLASFFVLVELLFMIPTTPAGLGVYEASIVVLFRLHGWSVVDGAAYAILIRLDDVLFSITGAVLLARFGLIGFLKGSSDA